MKTYIHPLATGTVSVPKVKVVNIIDLLQCLPQTTEVKQLIDELDEKLR